MSDVIIRAGRLSKLYKIGALKKCQGTFRAPSKRFFEITLIVLSLLAAGLVFVATSRYGIGLNTDAVGYVSTAQLLREGKGFSTYTEDILYVKYTPLYPMSIAFFNLFFQDIYAGIRFFNIITAIVIVYVSGKFFRLLFPNVVALLGAFLVTVSPALLHIHTMAWSEPFFILLVMLFFLQVPSYLEQSTLKGAVFLAVLTALATLQRYVGVTLVPIGVLTIIIAHNTQGIRKKMQFLMIYMITASAPLGLWLFRNYLLTSTLTGNRSLSRYSLEDNTNSLLFTLSRWFFPVHELPNVPAVVALAIFSCLLVLIVMHIFRTDSVRVKTILLTSCFILCYALFLIRMSIYSNDPIHERYMAPIFIPFMFLILVGFYQCANFSERFFPNPKMHFAVLVVFCLWLLYPTAMTFRHVIIKFRDGAGGYSTKQYQNSMMLQWIQQYPWDGIIYSNWHDVFYLFSDQKAKLLPRKGHDLLQFRDSLRRDERYYIVWFSKRFRYGVYSLDAYKQILTLRAIKHFPEGDIYEIQLPDS